MIDFQVQVIDKQVSLGLEKLGNALPGVVNVDIEQALTNAQYELQQPGSPPTYPINWDSEKQRRAYFATKGFGAGIPYQRTGAGTQGWTVVKTGYKLERAYTLSNKKAYTQYVWGDAEGKQSKIHRGRWPVAALVIKRHVMQMLVNVAQSVHDAIRNAGFGL